MADRSMVDTARVTAPDVSYARSGDVSIAYQVVGTGPVDIVFVRGITGDLLSTWDQPLLVRHVEGLAAIGRVLMLDKRGTGSLGSRSRGAVPRDLDGRHPCGDGRRRVGARSALERRDEYGHRHALRGDISRALRRSRPVRSEDRRAPALTTTRGHRRKRSGVERWPRCEPAGATEATWSGWRRDGPPRSPRTRCSATGSSGTCAAASALALP